MLLAGKFELVTKLGEGAFGVVYEAQDTFLQRPVAIKTIRTDAFSSPTSRESFEKRLLREARSAARLSHTNIISVHEAGRDGDVMYIAMEFVKGKTLRQIMDEKGAQPVEVVLPIAEALLHALHYAHTSGVVHRDIKPENLMMREDGMLKIADFGIARALWAESSTLTHGDVLVGTPCYMAPEQVLSKPTDPRSDLFSTSVVLYEMLSGTRPFSADSVLGLLHQVLSMPVPPLSSLVSVPAHVEAAIMRGLSKSPDDRFQSGKHYLDALHGTPSPAPPPHPRPIPSAATGLEPVPPPLPPGPVRRWVPPTTQVQAHETGILANVPAPELLLALRRREETGLLIVETPAWNMGIDLLKGAPLGVSGGPPHLALGEMLLKMGFVDEKTHARLLSEYQVRGDPRTKVMLGNVALRSGLLDSTQVLAALEAQIDAKLDALLQATDGTYRFFRGQVTGEWTEMAPRPIEGLIVKSLLGQPKRRQELIEGFLRRHGKERVKSTPRAIEMFPLYHFGPRMQRLLHLLDGRTIEDALGKSPIPRSDAEMVLYLLYAAGGLDIET